MPRVSPFSEQPGALLNTHFLVLPKSTGSDSLRERLRESSLKHASGQVQRHTREVPAAHGPAAEIEQLNPEVKSMGNITRPGTPTEITAGNGHDQP